MEEFFIEFGALFNAFQWWSLLLVVATVGIMYPVNLLWKKLMTKGDLARLRKIVAFASVYVVALIVVCVFTGIFSAESFADAKYVFSSTIALGFCSQIVWELVKVIRDYGFKKFIAYLSEKIDWKKTVKAVAKQYNVNTKLVNEIISQIEKIYVNEENINTLIDERLSIIDDIKGRLQSAVNSEKLEDTATAIYGLVIEYYNEDIEKEQEYIEIK